MEKTIHSAQYARFLDVLRRAREDAGLTQEDVAERIGESQSFVSKCERGERRIDVVELRNFCRAMDLPLQAFIRLFEFDLEREPHRPKRQREGRPGQSKR